jgi:hypothetical protein
MDDIVSATWCLRETRTFTRLGSITEARDGKQIDFAVWEGRCVICRKPFLVKTLLDAKQSTKFQITTCPAHRMTRSESARLRNAKGDKRNKLFASIKRGKLKATKRG